MFYRDTATSSIIATRHPLGPAPISANKPPWWDGLRPVAPVSAPNPKPRRLNRACACRVDVEEGLSPEKVVSGNSAATSLPGRSRRLSASGSAALLRFCRRLYER